MLRRFRVVVAVLLGGLAGEAAEAQHWAWQPIRRPAVPDVDAAGPIDAFVVDRLHREGIAASPEADAPTQLRRLCLALTGLPPTPAQARAAALGAFEYDATVDQLLASPAHAEHLAAQWLDLARYADTKGYEKDARRPSVWRWRDWVIAAFARDLPYDEFVTEQLAGDLLPYATEDQRIATAFHRLTMTNDEGGTDDEEFRCEAVVDRVDTTFQVLLGTTIGCARCHDHKYDPFTQREYYRLFAFFDQTADADRADEAPVLEVDTAFGKVAVPVMQELPADARRTTQVFVRGSFLARGDVVTPGTPSSLPPFPADAPPDRLGLARWITASDNPLFARVTVNRIWEQLFGRGLVATSDDFGTRGAPPSHPELLDWLACELRDDGWSLRRLIARIVRSDAFRRSSVERGDLRDRDPENVLLARGPRVRLRAETIRDCALAASGLLSRDVGGPSAMPPQPPGIWANTYSNDRWQDQSGPARWRRGLYTFWRRTSPYPTFAIFDAPSRERCTLRRVHSNTPLQALALLNDPAFVECAVALARAETAAEPMFVRALGRVPMPVELQRLERFVADEAAHYAEDRDAATALVGSDDPALAARAMAASALMNLDEFVSRR